jgi:AraC-like DNA-binding protein
MPVLKDSIAQRGTGLSIQHLDFADLPPRQRFEAWRTLTGPFFEVHRADDSAGTFEVRIASVQLGDTLLIETHAVAQHYDRSQAHAHRGGWDQVAFQHYSAGSFRGSYDGRQVAAQAGDLNIIDFTRPYVKCSTDEVDLNMIVPRETVERYFPSFTHGAVIPASHPLGRLAGTHLATIFSNAARLGDRDASQAVAAFLTILSGVSINRASPETIAFARAALRAVALGYIADNLTRPGLDSPSVARYCGVSRASLYRAFEIDGGVHAQIVRQRLHLAHSMLRRKGTAQVQDVATACGFDDPSQFARLFRRAFGAAPSDVRNLAAGLPDAPPTDPDGWIGTVRRIHETVA